MRRMILPSRTAAFLLCAAGLGAHAAHAAPRDQTPDIALVATFLAKVRQGDPAAAAALARGAQIADSRTGAARSLAQFAGYAAGCPLRRVYAVPVHSSRDPRPLPLGMEWACRYPERERTASAWVENGRIRKLTFGAPVTVRIPATPRPKRRN
jgi:hypothetical protein